MKNRLPVLNYIKSNGYLTPYNGTNKTISQNNVIFLKQKRNNMKKDILNNINNNNNNWEPDPYSSDMNHIGYKINLAQNIVNKAKERRTKYISGVKQLESSSLPVNVKRIIMNKTKLKNTF